MKQLCRRGFAALLPITLVLSAAAPAALPPLEDTVDAPAVRWIFYTSGTTADPKGCLPSDRRVGAAARAHQTRVARHRAHQGHHLAAVDVEADAAQHLERAVARANVRALEVWEGEIAEIRPVGPGGNPR